jgi:hypothetical protein
MKGTPERAAELDISAAAQAANALTTATAREDESADAPTKFVNIRMRQSDYNRLKGLYGSKGLSVSAGLKMSAFYIADLVDQGTFALTPGGIVDRRGR